MQAVDGLKTSNYLVQTAVRNIEGEISFEQANALLQSYYEQNPVSDLNDRTEEADIKSVFTAKTASHIDTLQKALKAELFFGRSDVQRLLNLKPTRCSELLREMAEHGIIGPVAGHGKGKYRFRYQENRDNIEQ